MILLPNYHRMIQIGYVAILILVSLGLTPSVFAQDAVSKLDVDSQQVLELPQLSEGEPTAGKRVAVTTPEYKDTQVFHTVYLPTEWKPNETLPIIFEYTGNRFPKSGSTGKVEDAGLGFGLSGGKYIWVALPYINKLGNANQATWWGDENATIQYAKLNVPRIIKEFGANPNAVILCGFSRGAIGVNYLGLHDDEIAKLWTALVTHDHFDGEREWRGTQWGSPLEVYRKGAAQRLQRVAGRPYLASQNGNAGAIRDFVQSSGVKTANFTFNSVNTKQILGEFPNKFAKHAHTDRWLYKPSPERTKVWEWINSIATSSESEFEDLLAVDELKKLWRIGKKGKGWRLKDGVVHLHQKKSGSLISRKKYKNFELKFDWKIAKGGNSGVIYRSQKGRGLEYQVLDDDGHVRGQKPIWSAAAIYDLRGAEPSKPYNAAGQWNSSRIVADGIHVEHWLNGTKVADLDVAGEDWDKRYTASKYPAYGLSNFANVASPITFQDHGSEVWYRNVLIRELKADPRK